MTVIKFSKINIPHYLEIFFKISNLLLVLLIFHNNRDIPPKE